MKKQSKWFKIINTEGFDGLVWTFCIIVFWAVMFVMQVTVEKTPFQENGGAIALLAIMAVALILFGCRCGYFAIAYKEKWKKPQPTHEDKFPKDIIYQSYSMYPEDYNVLVAWKNEVGVKYLATHNEHHDDGTYTLVIFTDKPGLMIGYHGETFDKYKAKLCPKTGSHKYDDIRFEPIDGFIVANERCDVDDFYRKQSQDFAERF